MNVMNRKMFANRDARRKLANMGGIVASSPELLGTAQTFQAGGGAFPRQEYADMLSGFQDMIFDRRQYDLVARSIPEIFGKYDPDNPRERRDAVREFAVSRLGKDAAREIFSRLPGVTSKEKEFRDDSTTLPLKGPGYALPIFGEEYRGGVPLRYENLANSMETRKGLASIYQQPNVASTSDLTEFEKIRQSMDAVPEAGQLDPLAAEKALLATDNATKVMALRRRIPVEEYINSLDPEVIRRNAQRVLEAQDSASIKAQDDAVISELTSRGEMPGQLDFVSVNPSYTENQTDRFNNLDKSSLTEPVTDAIVPRPRDIRDQDPRTLNLGQKAVQDLVIAEENKESPGLLQSGFDYSQLKPEEKPSFMDVLNLGADITVEGTKRIDQALFGDYEDKLLPVGSVPTATEEVREINELLKNETDPLRIQVLNRRREELLGKLNLEEFDKDAKEFIMSLPQTAGDLAGKAGSALYRLYQENVVASNDPEAAYNNLTSLAESDAFTEKLIELRDEEANQKEAAREKELAELKAGGSDPEFKTMDQARLEAQNVILNKPSEETETKTETPSGETGAGNADTDTGTGGGDAGAGAGAGGASNAEIVTTTENAVTNATEEGGDTNEAASKAILDTAGINTSDMSTKERVTSFKNLLSELAGDTDEEKKEEFWMNMAMIGFGVAAGESESALKNIADGLLAGSSQMLKSRAKRKAREDKFTMAALDNVLAEQRAETKFGRDVKLAGIRASGSDQTKPANFNNVLLKEETNIRDQNKKAISLNDPSIIPENEIRFEALRRLKDTPAYKEEATPLFIQQKKILNKE
tara:strand:- start:27 stop:2471 length:2445 start_codon:yes stop_codon:yes gene_type:complete